MPQGDHPDTATVTPLHATFTILPDGSPNQSVGVALQVELPSGASRRVDTEVPLTPAAMDQAFGAVCREVVARAMAVEGLTTLTPPRAAADIASADEGGSPDVSSLG